MKINMEDWFPNVQDKLKCECEIESLPPPIPPKMIQPLAPYTSHQNESYSLPTAVVMESELLSSAPALPPKPVPRTSEKW